MKRTDSWRPTKYILNKNGNWSPNKEYIGKFSYHTAQLQIRSYEKFIKKYAHGRLLDCGAGTVPYYGIYKGLVDEVICVDWGNSPHQTDHIDKQVDLTKPLPFDDNSFDTLLLADVLEHLPNPENIFSESARVLRKGGALLVFVPFLYWIHERPHDYFRYTEFALVELGKRAGFSKQEVEAYGGATDVVVDMLDKLTHKNRLLFSLNKSFWYLIKRLPGFASFRQKNIRTFPLGYSAVFIKNG